MNVMSRIYRLILNNFWLKVVSLAFACVLYVIVRNDQVKEFSMTGRVRIVTASNVVVVGAQERAVELQIKLPNSIFALPPGEDEVLGVLDVSEQTVGRIRVRLNRENFPGLDERFAVTILDPWMEVELDEVIARRIPVRAVLQGLPSESLAIEKVIVDPEDVEVTGARREIEKMETLSTSPVNIDGITQNFSATAAIEVNENSSLQVSQNKINVQVFVGRERSNRVFENVPVGVRSSEGRAFQVSPDRITVELRGLDAQLREMTKENITAFVDATEYTGPDSLLKVWLKIPMDSSLVRVTPDKVRVSVK